MRSDQPIHTPRIIPKAIPPTTPPTTIVTTLDAERFDDDIHVCADATEEFAAEVPTEMVAVD